MKSVIIYGPEICSKTTRAKEFAKVYGCKNILDDWSDMRPIPASTLALTNVEPPYRHSNFKAIEYSEAICKLN